MAKKRNRHYLTQRDINILMFLWTYKVATTAMLYHKFFEGLALRSAYNTLQKIKRYSYLEIRTDDFGKKPLWTLGKKGFEVIKEHLPELQAQGFKSESREHDLLASSIQLGEFLKETPVDIKIISEQLLRTYHQEFLPNWIPNTNEHRPDGYWYFINGNSIKLMSLEVEINEKSFVRYDGYSNFYEKFDPSSRVLWIVKRQNQARQILKAMYKYQPDYKVHNFVELKDILINGWGSLIFAGRDKGNKVQDLFYENSQYISSNTLVKDFNNYLLDRRLTYQINSKNQATEKQKNSDCIGPSA